MSLHNGATRPMTAPGRPRTRYAFTSKALRQIQRSARIGAALAIHVIRLQRSGQLRFRAETFGVYYPALPYARPWWRISPAPAIALLRQALNYGRWLVEMDDLRRHGAPGWWESRVPAWEGVDHEP